MTLPFRCSWICSSKSRKYRPMSLSKSLSRRRSLAFSSDMSLHKAFESYEFAEHATIWSALSIALSLLEPDLRTRFSIQSKFARTVWPLPPEAKMLPVVGI
jgi:hypothetical protein